MESQRDWGRAQDYVQAMWLMLQYHTADDYVVATGESHSVRDFVEAAFAVVDLPWQKYVKHDPAFDRPAEPARLAGCADKIRKKLAGSLKELFASLSAKWLKRSSPRSAECKMKMLIKKCLAKVFQPLIGAINDSRDSLVAENQKHRLETLRILRDPETKMSCLAAKSLPAKRSVGCQLNSRNRVPGLFPIWRRRHHSIFDFQYRNSEQNFYRIWRRGLCGVQYSIFAYQ